MNKDFFKIFQQIKKPGDKLLEASINLASTLSPEEDNYSSISHEINKALLQTCESGIENAKMVYDAVLSVLENTDWKSPEESLKTVVLLDVFSDDQLNLFGSNTYLRQALRLNHERLLALVKLYTEKGDQKIYETTSVFFYGTYADVAQRLINLYFYHARYSGDEDLRKDLALFIPEFYMNYPESFSNITFSLFSYHPKFIKEISRLVSEYAKGSELSVIYDIALGLMGGKDELSRKSSSLLKELSKYSEEWGTEEWDRIAEVFLFYTFENKIDKLINAVNRSKDRRAVLDWILSARSPISRYKELADVLKKNDEKLKNPVTDPLHEGKGVVFKDIIFKLFVINELMYKSKVLKPALNVHKFPGEDIDVEEDGYDIIPQVKKYFEKVVLTEEHLSKITKLRIGATADIIFQIYPFWDGEDDVFEIKSIDDIKHLPNLKEIDFEEFEHLKVRFGKKLEKAGVKVL